MSLPRKGIALPNRSCRMMPSASRAIPRSVRRRITILPRSNHSMSISLSFLFLRGYAWLLAVEQVENDGDRHQSHDAVAAQRREELEQVADDIAAQERHGGAEQHLQHDGERHQQKAQLRDLEDPGFGLVEHLHHLLFLRFKRDRRGPRFTQSSTIERGSMRDYARGTRGTCDGLIVARANAHECIVILLP